ncbi:MAG: MATE family efflux transporter [Firmicutes bacterium]|nr:MATE family efflux transporter [Bacillota bacterium]
MNSNPNALSGESRGSYLKKIFAIVLPIALQNLLGCAMGIVDTAMVGRMGVAPLAASGAASMVAIVLFNFMYGFLSGSGAFISQYWGIRDIETIRKVLGVIYRASIFVSLIFSIVGELFAPQIIWLIDRDPEVIDLGVQYLRVIAPSYALAMLSYSFMVSSRCVQRLRAATIIDICAILLNSLLNYMFIWGKFGAPAWGIKGAAFATVLSRVFECSAFIIYSYAVKDHPLAFRHLSELSGYTKEFRNRILKTAIPVGFSDGLWGVTCTVYLSIYGMIGTAAVAAVQVINIVNECFQSVFYGVGSAAAVLITEQLGQANLKRAKKSAVQFLWTGVGLSALMTLFMLLISPFLIGFYHFDEATNQVLSSGLSITAWTIIMRMMCYIIMCGVLRPGGDTTFPMVVDLVCNWALIIPAMLIAVRVFHADLRTTMFLCYLGEGIKGVICYFRYRGGQWINVLTGVESSEAAADVV